MSLPVLKDGATIRVSLRDRSKPSTRWPMQTISHLQNPMAGRIDDREKSALVELVVDCEKRGLIEREEGVEA